eukprot:Nk52_evm24s222 gene=Nk52_evmTU24s222
MLLLNMKMVQGIWSICLQIYLRALINAEARRTLFITVAMIMNAATLTTAAMRVGGTGAGVLIVMFFTYVLWWRPRQRRRREAQALDSTYYQQNPGDPGAVQFVYASQYSTQSTEPGKAPMDYGGAQPAPYGTQQYQQYPPPQQNPPPPQ